VFDILSLLPVCGVYCPTENLQHEYVSKIKSYFFFSGVIIPPMAQSFTPRNSRECHARVDKHQHSPPFTGGALAFNPVEHEDLVV